MVRRSSLLALVAVLGGPTVDAQQDSLQVGKFYNPPNAIDGTVDYSTNPVWRLGEVQNIKFTTTYSNYSIDLWQENPDWNSAQAGPSIFQTRSGAVTQFDWSVQVFEFDLKFSNVFFLWLSPLESDDPNPLSVTSRYFNITDEPLPSTTTSSTTSASATDAPSSTPTTGSATGTGTSLPLTSSTSDDTSTGLSAGAAAGIGVGVAVLVLALAAGGVFWWRRRQRSNPYQAPSAAGAPGPSNDLPAMMAAQSPPASEQKPPFYPVELEGGGGAGYPGPYYTTNRAELDSQN